MQQNVDLRLRQLIDSDPDVADIMRDFETIDRVYREGLIATGLAGAHAVDFGLTATVDLSVTETDAAQVEITSQDSTA